MGVIGIDVDRPYSRDEGTHRIATSTDKNNGEQG